MLLYSRTMLTDTLQTIAIPKGVYRALRFRFTGTNDADSTGTVANMGTLTPIYRGVRLGSFNVSNLREFAIRHLNGVPYFTSTQNSTFEFNAIYPFHVEDGNVVSLQDGELSLELSYSTLTAIFSALTLEVYAEYGVGVMRYLPVFRSFSIPPLGARSEPKIFEGVKNLMFLALAYSANHSQILLKVRNTLIYDVTPAALNVLMQAEGRLQTYSAAVAASGATPAIPYFMNLYKDKNLLQVAGNQYRFGVVNTTDTTVTGFVIEAWTDKVASKMSADMVADMREKRLAADEQASDLVY